MTSNHAGPIIAERDGLQVRQCFNCAYAHLDPLPDPRVLDAYYKDTFWNEKGKGWIKLYEAERDWSQAKNGDVLSVIEQHTLGRLLLDVGAGFGFFVADATARGWQASGIDASAEASAYARARLGADVRNETWEAFWPSKYDAITAFWLFEHLPAPLDFLKWTRRHLYTGGTLTLAVPLEWSQEMIEASRVARVSQWWVHASHSAYFTAASLCGLLGRAGYRVVDMLTTFPMARFITEGGKDYTADSELGADCHAIIRSAELATPRGKRIEEARERAMQNVGRDLIVVAKPE